MSVCLEELLLSELHLHLTPDTSISTSTMPIGTNFTDATTPTTTAGASASSTTPILSTRPLTIIPPPHSRSTRPVSSLQPVPRTHSQYSYSTHCSPNHLYARQKLPILSSNSQPTKPYDSSGVLYPVASSGRGFIPRGVRPPLTNSTTGYPPSSLVTFPHALRPSGLSTHLESLHHSLHMVRPPNSQYTHLGSSFSQGSGPLGGVQVSANPKGPPASSVPDSNGYTDMKESSRDNSIAIVRERKVKIKEGASLYVLCRSWLGNDISEESQLQSVGHTIHLPEPLPATAVDNHPLNSDNENEDDESVENLSTEDILKRHVQRAKRIRARLREVRLQRIARYRNRLRLLLPSPVEQIPPDTANQG